MVLLPHSLAPVEEAAEEVPWYLKHGLINHDIDRAPKTHRALDIFTL